MVRSHAKRFVVAAAAAVTLWAGVLALLIEGAKYVSAAF